ncbi:MAG: hypothetical protein IKR69_04380 [Bacteroidales bacterium]|nr:hypothetical protein [Bacteroidales bacterium]
MKRTAFIALLTTFLAAQCILAPEASAQKILKRFTDPEKGPTVFVSKDSWGMGISGGYRNFKAGGMYEGDGYSLLSWLNIGDGQLNLWEVSPKFAYFISDDVSIGFRLAYTGFSIKTNIKMDLRDVVGTDDENLNLQLSALDLVRHGGNASFTARRYLSFFGSRTFGIFGEGRLYASFGHINTVQLDKEGNSKDKIRVSDQFGIGIKLAAGLCVKLRDNSAFEISVPLLGAGWQSSKQNKYWQGNSNKATMSGFNISRELDFLAIQIGYMHFIEPKHKKATVKKVEPELSTVPLLPENPTAADDASSEASSETVAEAAAAEANAAITPVE